MYAPTTSIIKINDMRILTPRLNLISKYCKKKKKTMKIEITHVTFVKRFRQIYLVNGI